MHPQKISVRLTHSSEVDRLAAETRRLNRQVQSVTDWMETARMQDLLQNYSSPVRVFWINLLAGLARGLGLTLGTAIVLSLLSILLSKLSGVPFFSDTLRDLKELIDHATPQ
ncbi:hypothetical protein GCM10011571_26110 [Marinithermofilum abyssi]|uniref:Uncharacterized protein n=1 Tax=Marinithermofilum abyssi TaxID=1571185 RepID=A0A8J2YE13_9BACL|nr:DUF5665 domain-containing protein [Marinithermofilum abyssi]GGE22805.1 hypothetical protein GCM10011571_26110 [Marinithermofilum abyssi]